MNAKLNYDVIIAGGGPAGSSAAIHLANRGARVLLVEQKKFPRAKLCGEFISPECATHFEKLGVLDRILAAHPIRLTKTVFYSPSGKSVDVQSNWFAGNGAALGLSRAEMDERLLRRAGKAGAEVIEGAAVTDLLFDSSNVCGVKLKYSNRESHFLAPITIDATGRTRALARRVASNGTVSRRPPLVAFKAHLQNTEVEPGACEIYFYRGGYGGLSSVEGGYSNLCFIASARDVRECRADAARVMREIVCRNHRAAATLRNATAVTDWLAVTLEHFGRHELSPAGGLLAVGDAASFIDPFTGSGMLMALESGELAAHVISEHLGSVATFTYDLLRVQYQASYRKAFASRLKICSIMRRAAFVPGLAEIAVRGFGLSSQLRRVVAVATRKQHHREPSAC